MFMENRKLKSLLIVGAGGYGRLVREIALTNGYEKIDFLDDENPIAIGKVNDIEKHQKDYDGCVIAIGNPVVRSRIAQKVNKNTRLIHSTAIVSPSAEIGEGCIIEAGVVINSYAHIMQYSIICAGAVVNHDAIVGEFCQIDCNAVVGAGTNVPEATKVEACSFWKEK